MGLKREVKKPISNTWVSPGGKDTLLTCVCLITHGCYKWDKDTQSINGAQRWKPSSLGEPEGSPGGRILIRFWKIRRYFFRQTKDRRMVIPGYLCIDMKGTIGWTENSSVWWENEEIEGVEKRKTFQACGRAFRCERTWSVRSVSNSSRWAESKATQAGM